uniref:Gustatory receptor n=1 Tax=Tetranychus urticae TaxID=32264 RepID=T1KJF3_TETUR
MTSINMQQCFVRNEQLKHYPKVSIDSIQSRYLLMISSTSNIYGKCLFVFIMFIINLVHCRALLFISLDSMFSVKFGTFLFVLVVNVNPILFYYRYNHKLVKQIENHWNGLQIDYDYETRKYFWTRKVIYRWLVYSSYILLYIFKYCYLIYTLSDQDTSKQSIGNVIFPFLLLILALITIFIHFCHSCIHWDLSLLAQTAVQFNLIKLKKLLNESRKDQKSLNVDAIQSIRHKYLLICRLVYKIDEIMSPSLFAMFTHFLAYACNLSYSLIYNEENQLTKWYNVILTSFILIISLVSTYVNVRIHEKSLESLAIVYKLSLRTDSIRILNEILLFLNHNEIGFTFGGMFMLTLSSLSTLFSILTTNLWEEIMLQILVNELSSLFFIQLI